MEIRSTNKINTQFLDGIRGLAALYVMLGHCRSLLWEGYSEGYLRHPKSYSFFDKLGVYFFSLFRYGHISVILFFVLSGFVIHHSISTKNLEKLPLADYLIKRFLRIYPPLIFSLILTFCLDYFGQYILHLSIYFHKTPYQVINENVISSLGILTLLGNLFMVQGFYSPVYGTNAPLWSLAYEWWFYLIYPLFYWGLKWKPYLTYLIIVVLFILGIQNLISINMIRLIFIYLLGWVLGAYLSEVIQGKKSPLGFLIPLILIPFYLWLSIVNQTKDETVLWDLTWALVFTGLLYLVFISPENGFLRSLLIRLKWLGNCSYSLYIVHYPILVFISGLVLSEFHNQLPKHSLFIILGAIITLSFAYFIHFIIEKPYFRNKGDRLSINRKG